MSNGDEEIKKIIRSAVIAGLIFLAIGTLHLFKRHPHFYITAFSLSLFFFVMGVFFTAAFKRLTSFIGSLITALLLALVFFIVITPLGLIMRLFGKDPLSRNIEKGKSSYWEKKQTISEDVKRYENQF
jgi:amino acid transporter